MRDDTTYDPHSVAALEQKCLKPGLWRIQGHTVQRHHSSKWWFIVTGNPPEHAFCTLRECREWIASQI